MMKTLDKRELVEVWGLLKEVSNDSGGQDALRVKLIERLALVASLPEALDFINIEVGKGSLKNQLIEGAFSTAKADPLELMALMDGLETESDREAARMALEYRAFKRGDFPLESFLGLKKLSDDGLEILRGAVMRSVTGAAGANGAGGSEAVAIALSSIQRLRSDGAIDATQEGRLLSLVAQNQPFALWTQLTAGGSANPGELDKGLFEVLIKNMASKSPEQTMRLLSGRSDVNADAYSKVMASWVERDSKAAKAWFEQSKGALDAASQDAVKSAFVDNSIKDGDLSAAREMLGQITDAKVKDNVSGKIWQVERDSLRSAVGKDPVGTVAGIVSGKSGYSAYWLEEAMNVWIQKDFEKANGWYEQNWNSLSADKSQYLAAAFATNAISQGDKELAEQWAGYIKDPKTKARIEAAIAKATQPK